MRSRPTCLITTGAHLSCSVLNPIAGQGRRRSCNPGPKQTVSNFRPPRSEEHTSELQSLRHLVCRLLLEKKKERNSRIRWQRYRRQACDGGAGRGGIADHERYWRGGLIAGASALRAMEGIRCVGNGTTR